MTRIICAIPTVPVREHFAHALNAQRLNNRAYISVDDGGLWKNAKHCWAWCLNNSNGASHAMVIQDDVIPVAGFLGYLRAVVKDRPNDILSLFCSRACDVSPATEAGASWLEYYTLCWGQAVVMPLDVVDSFLNWSNRHLRDDWNIDDQRIALYAAVHGRSVFCTNPSLVQHRTELKSTWMDRDGANLKAPSIGCWQPGPTFEPYQRGIESFLKSKERRYKVLTP